MSFFIPFAETCERLAADSSKLAKRALIAGYLRTLPAHDAARAALYFGGRPFAETDSRQLNAGGALLWRALASLSKASEIAMHAAYRRHGDLGAAAFDLLTAIWGGRQMAPTLTFENIDSAFAAIAAAQKPAAKLKLVEELIEHAMPLEAKYLIKIILGDLRIGVKESLVEEAIAETYNLPLLQIRRAMSLNGSTAEILLLAAEGRVNEARMKLFHPLGFMLASPVATVEAAVGRFSQLRPADEGPEDGTRERPPAQIEDKYDGVRAQIHCGDPEQPGRVAVFSRTRENITESFPEIAEAFAEWPLPAIFDGEILAWDPHAGSSAEPRFSAEPRSGRALPFSRLQARLGRKQVSAKMRREIPVVFVAFDLLYAAGELLLEQPLAMRRKLLADLAAHESIRTVVGEGQHAWAVAKQAMLQFEPPGPEDQAFPRLVLAPATQLESAEQLEQAYADARIRGNEGVMIKALESTYQPGRRGLAWLKLKRELATLDVVVTAAEYGHGKRAGVLSDYTFAVRDGEALKNVGKAYSGLTDAEIAALTEFFKQHTLEDFGSIRSVEPVVVLEVAFNNVMLSNRHDSGFALRFPRIVRIRNDKPVSEIDTIERVAEIYHSQDASQKVE